MIFIYGEQLNWLFTEHGTTEVVKTRPVHDCALNPLSNFLQILTTLSNF